MFDYVLGTALARSAIALAMSCAIASCNDKGKPVADAGHHAGSAGGNKHDAGAAHDAGSSSDAAAAHDAGATTHAAIPTGKACTDDSDCDGATCAKTFGGRMPAAAPGGYCTAACSAPTDCDRDSACIGARFGFKGMCAIGCKTTRDCRSGYRCFPFSAASSASDAGGMQDAVTGTCQPTPETDLLADGIVGSACMQDVDCGDGSCLLSESVTSTPYPGGYCTGRCVDDSDCGARGLCTPGFLGAIGSCALRCTDDGDCARDGYRCRVIDAVGRCAPGPKPLPDHVAGKACKSDDDCGGGAMTCADQVSMLPAPDRYCSQHCAVDADCGSGGLCINGIGVITLSTGICYQSCVPPGGCRDGYTCRSLSGAASDARGGCVPSRENVDAGGP